MGYRDSKKTTCINTLLIAINVLCFIFLEMTGSSGSSLLMIQHGTVYEPLVTESGKYYRLLTSIFMRLGVNHIVNNMLMFFILGDNMERALGRIKYPFSYLICGVDAGVASMTVDVINKKLVMSARTSEAIFGVIGGLLYAVAMNRGRLKDLSTRQLVIVILCSLYFGFTSGDVDSVAHITGLFIGVVAAMLLYRKPKPIYEDRL